MTKRARNGWLSESLGAIWGMVRTKAAALCWWLTASHRLTLWERGRWLPDGWRWHHIPPKP
jgi:hypothetical protein